MKPFKILLVAILFSGSAQAADLEQLQKTALENRNVVLRYQNNVEISKNDLRSARSGYFPSVDVSYTGNSLDEENLFEDKENNILYAALSWNLFDGFSDVYKSRSKKLLVNAESYRLKGLLQNIQLNVALRYLDVYRAGARLKVTEDSYSTLLKIYKDSKGRFDVGLIGKNELLKFKVDLDNALIDMKKAQAQQAKSVKWLERETGANVVLEQLAFSEFGELPKLDSLDSYESRMLEVRSEVRALEESARAAKFNARSESADYFPKIDLVHSIRKYENSFMAGDGDTEEDETRTQLVVSMNLFNGFSTTSGRKKAKLQAQALDYDLDELKSELMTELRNLLLDFEVSLSNVQVSKNSIEQAQENLRITRLKYKEGIERESDLLDAIANLSRAKSTHVRATTEVFSNYFLITRAIEGYGKQGEI
jgi:outer membrane protein TolC